MKMRKNNLLLLAGITVLVSCQTDTKIDRKALVTRNNPVIRSIDKYSSLSVGNGEFAFTVDATGLQSFPEAYTNGVSLGTQSQWGWHSFVNSEKFRFEETLKQYDFGRGREEPYAVQFNEKGRQQDAANWFRENPHRMHLGTVGFEMIGDSGQTIRPDQVSGIEQQLNLWNGCISSHFEFEGQKAIVQTVCHPNRDMIAASVRSEALKSGKMNVALRFPYPSAKHTDDACNWNAENLHVTRLISSDEQSAVLCHSLDSTTYFISIQWDGPARFEEAGPHWFRLLPEADSLNFTVEFLRENSTGIAESYASIAALSDQYWQSFWSNGAAVDFSECTDSRAKELERRVILSQYLMAIQCAGSMPPQETGLTFNSWYGKFHLEMHWWHAVHFALWNRPQLMEKSLGWYKTAFPIARSIAERQGFKGVRWMKMTDPSASEAPSKVGSFLIWQQPHIIYMAELLYRDHPSAEVIDHYKELVFETAAFMADFATLDTSKNRYVLKGIIPAQETLRASETVNPPFELSYWHFALSLAQKWRERAGLPQEEHWQDVIDRLSPLASLDSLYLAAETAPETYKDIRFTSDHMAVLGAVGILPENRLVDQPLMTNTLHWIWDNWNWDTTWGWDFPMTAMNAARMGEPEKAVGALLMNKQTNTYLPNGHNYKDDRLRIYLPGNGGLLTAVAMMCAGWDGCTEKNPGFPKDGTWKVKWEGLKPMP